MRKHFWRRSLLGIVALLSACAIAATAGCRAPIGPVVPDGPTKGETLTAHLADKSPKDIEEVRRILKDAGVTDFAAEEANTWLFWSETQNRIISVSAAAVSNGSWSFAPGFALVLRDADGKNWFPLLDFGGLGDKLASAEFSAGKYSEVLPGALDCGVGDIVYLFGQNLLKDTVICNGSYVFGDKTGVSVLGSAEDARRRAGEEKTKYAILGSDAPSVFADFTSLTSAYVSSEVKSVGDAAFYHCTALSSAEFPGAESLGESAFFASGLERIVLPASVKKIPATAFGYCQNLREVEWTGVTEVGAGAFYLCTNLTSVSGTPVTAVGEEAFFLCEKLETFDFLSAETEIGADAFYGTQYEEE